MTKKKWPTGTHPDGEDAYHAVTFMRMVTEQIRSEVFGVRDIRVSFEEHTSHLMIRVIGLCNGRRLSLDRYIEIIASSKAASTIVQEEVDEMVTQINKSSLDLRSNPQGLTL